MKLNGWSLIVVTSFVLVGCSKSSTPNSNSPSAPSAGAMKSQSALPSSQSVCASISEFMAKQDCERREEDQQKLAIFMAAIDKLPAGNPATPDSSYRVLTTMEDVAFLEAGLPVVADQTFVASPTASIPAQVAEMAFDKYRNEHDAFKRQDLLTSLTPQIQQGIDAAKNRKYIILDVDIGLLGLNHYDPQVKGFPFNLGDHRIISIESAQIVNAGLETQSANYRIDLLNSGSLPKVITPADEDTARRIEAKITSGHGHDIVIRLYCYARATRSLASNLILADVMREQLIESK